MGRKGHCREHMLESGLTVMFTHGYNGTGVKDIVDAAGVPKGSFYNHFKSKQAFVVEAITLLADRDLSQSKALLTDASKSPRERLLTWFDASNDEMVKSNYEGGCMIGNLCLEMADSDEEIRETINNIMSRFVRLIASCLEDAKARNELSSKSDSLELAEFIHCAWEGTIMHMRASKSEKPYLNFRNQISAYFS